MSTVRASSGLSFVWLWITACQPDPPFLPLDRIGDHANPPQLGPAWKEDVITRVGEPKVDVLWVIDDSLSMAEEQTALVENFGAFISFFVGSGLDWHVGVVSTDTTSDGAGRLVTSGGDRYLTPDTPDPGRLFTDLARVGTGGSGDERGFEAAFLALTPPRVDGYNAGFYREDAELVVIAISDEDDHSLTPTMPEFESFMRSLKGSTHDATFSAIVGPRGGCATAEEGSRYLAMADALGGLTASICAADWAPILSSLGLEASGLTTEYFLSSLAVPDTIEVWVEDAGYVFEGERIAAPGEPLRCDDTTCFGFTYDPIRNSVLLDDYVPGALAKVHVRYDLLGSDGT